MNVLVSYPHSVLDPEKKKKSYKQLAELKEKIEWGKIEMFLFTC